MASIRARRWACSILLAATVGAPLALPAAGQAQQAVVIRAEYDENTDSTIHRLLAQLAKELEASTGGQVKLEPHSGASLSGGKIPTMIQNVQAGSVDLSFVPTSIYSATDPRVGVLSLPFMFTATEELEKVRKAGILNKVYAEQTVRNLHVVDAWTRPLRQFVMAKREVRAPKDAVGMRFRVPEFRLWVDAFKAIGAVPVPLPSSEIPTAIQLGTIEGAERPTDMLQSERWWELAKYVTVVNYSGDVLMASFNKGFWDRLDPKTQELLTQKLRAYGDQKFAADLKSEKTAIEAVKANGMAVSTLTPAEVEAFREAMRPVWASAAGQIGQPLIDAVRAAASTN